MRILASVLALGCLVGSAVADDSDHDIDLKLFGEQDVAPYDGCRLAFWQQDRDPQADRYAYVFFAPFNDGEMLPAWIKVGEEITEVSQIDMGIDSGGQLAPYQLFADSEGTYRVLLNIREQSEADTGIDVASARLTFLKSDKFPFNMIVKGHLSCPTAAAEPEIVMDESPDVIRGELWGDEINLSSQQNFQGYENVPRPLRRYIAQELPGCDPVSTAGYGARYAVSDVVSLWEIPCAVYAAQGSSIFAVAFDDAAEYFTFLTVPGVDGPTPETEIMSAQVLVDTAEIISESVGRDDSCGTYQRFQLRLLPGEEIEMQLVEKRQRETCDGAQISPPEFPLIYSAN